MSDHELMQQALEALTGVIYRIERDLEHDHEWAVVERELAVEAIAALRAALAEPQPEKPMAKIEQAERDLIPQDKLFVSGQLGANVTRVRKERKWQGLTKREFLEAVDGLEDLEDCWVAIQAKLKEKNG